MLDSVEIIDKLKQIYNTDLTLFLGDVRFNTTIVQNGSRLVGTKLDSEIANIVLNKKEKYTGSAEILGIPYICSYMPLINSANAAKETTEMIENSIKNVEDGTKIANKTAEALDSIVESISKVANLVNDIAVASNEQATGIAQVNQAINQVSQIVQTNSASSQESASASEELMSQAEMLKEQVSKFVLTKNKSSSDEYL